MRVFAAEEMFFSGYGLTLVPGENDIPEPEPRLRRLLQLMPGIEIRDELQEPKQEAAAPLLSEPTVAPVQRPRVQTVKRRRRK